MSKEKENMIVPKLRFPEFHNNGDWAQTMLGEISEIVRGGSPRPIEEYLTTDSSGLNWLKIGDVSSDSKYIVSTKERVIQSALGKTREVFPGDLILSNSMSFGRPYILKIKTCIHDGWIAITQISDWVNTDYLYYLILTPSSQVYFLNYSAGSGVQNLNADIIKMLPVTIPKPAEQKKIASCLSSLDDLITAHTQKLDALKAHKKGLMQQLFPAEGEKVPNRRFEEFKDSGEWTKRKLEDLIDLQSGYAFQSEYFSNDGMKLVTPKNFTKEGYGNFTGDNTKYTTEETDSKYICRAGDLLLLLTDLTPTCELLGKPLLLTEQDGDVLLNQRIAKIVSKENIEISFLHCYFSAEMFHKRITDTATGSTVRHSSNTIVLNTELFVPSKDEQQKISSCLSALDKLIKAQAEKVEELKNHKKGLTQALFPKMVE